MIITFGKYNGRDTLELASSGQTGRSYLEWGAQNLQSPKWRRAFQEALAASVEYSVQSEANLITADERFDSQERAEMVEYLKVMERERVESDAKWETWRQELYQIVNEHSIKMGITFGKANAMVKRYFESGDYQEVTAKNFSSPEKHTAFIEFMQALDASYNKINWY